MPRVECVMTYSEYTVRACILCGATGVRPALVLPCDTHDVCLRCVWAVPEPYTQGEADDWAMAHSDARECVS